MSNFHTYPISLRDYIRRPEFLAGYRSAWRGEPFDYNRHSHVGPGSAYAVGRQLAIYMRAENMTGGWKTPPTQRAVRKMSRATGFPRIRGVNA